jgi:IPT/TIG domain
MTIKLTIKSVLLAAGLVVYGYAAAGGSPIPSNMQPSSSIQPSSNIQPSIVKVAVSNEGDSIVIIGRNFGNASPPTVYLAGESLMIIRFSDKEVVAALPPGTDQATYSLTVSTAGNKRQATSGVFHVSIPGTTNVANRTDP